MESASETRRGVNEVAKETPTRMGREEVDMDIGFTAKHTYTSRIPARTRRKRKISTDHGFHSETESNDFPVTSRGKRRKCRSVARKQKENRLNPASDGPSSESSVGVIRASAVEQRRISSTWRQEKFRSISERQHRKANHKHSIQGACDQPSMSDSFGDSKPPCKQSDDECPSLELCLYKLSLLRVVVPYQTYTAAIQRLLNKENRCEFIQLDKPDRVNWIKSTVVPPEIAAIKVAPRYELFDPNVNIDDLPSE